MRSITFDWCYEGGCTYMDDRSFEDEPDTDELEAMYREPCIGMLD